MTGRIVRPTSFDVADLAGVSQSTVSRALRGNPGVNLETRERVEAAARQLGYVVDRHASSLRLKSSETLALICICRPGEDRAAINPFYFSLLGSIAAATSARGFNLIVSFQDEPGNFRSDFVSSGLADAMILIGTTSNGAAWDHWAAQQAKGVRFVCWGSPGSPFAWLRSDNLAGGRMAARHLIERGRRRLAFVGPLGTSQQQFDERHAGFTAEATSAQASVQLIEPDPMDDRLSQGEAAAQQLIDAGLPCDGIFAACDMIALGMLQRFERAGIAVPDSVAIVGFDGIRAGSLASPQLTTIEPHLEEAGLRLVAMALDDDAPDGDARTPVNLVVRSST